ncbi:MAG: pilus assembly protein PilM [Proteobacteria bacterium]|nr:pilus assembly protein PilM [Pseudomonadota bacterium]MBU1738942.1 pilus assembly protein PilM [Pseudomonadota bacterium]
MGGLKLPKFSFNIPFLGGQKLAVGLDIGSHSVKICQLAQSGSGYKLVCLGSATLPPDSVEDGVLQNPEAVSKAVSGLIKNLKLKGKKVAISISGYSVIVKKINLAVMDEEELASHIQAEAEQYIPFDIDDVYMDFQDLKTNTADDDRTDIMLVAAKKEVVNGYLEVLGAAGLKTIIVDVDAFALENAYGATFGGSNENIGLVDIGASKMNINIVSNGTSVLARDIVLGSRLLTEQIQNHFGISFEEAEALKIGSTSSEEKKRELEDIFVNTCTQWVTEVKRALDFYYSNYPEETINKLVLSGGGAKVKGLAKLFSEETGIKTHIFNPFARTESDPSKIDNDYLNNIAPEMALSTGLATRSADI